MIRTQSDITGHCAEHFVCYDLAKRGMRVLNNPYEQSPYDVLAEINGILFKIQVKGSATFCIRNTSNANPIASYRFNYASSKMQHCDLVAFVALDLEKIIYKIPDSISVFTKGVSFAPVKMVKGDDADLLALLALT